MRCRPGDLAVILKSDQYPVCGKVCEVVDYALPGERVFLPDGRKGMPPPGPDWWLVRLMTPTADCPEWGIARDSNLLPIRPDPGEEAEQATELEEPA